MDTGENVIDYTAQLQTIIEQQAQLIELLQYQTDIIAQTNVDILFCIGVAVPVFVLVVLYKAIKKFI